MTLMHYRMSVISISAVRPPVHPDVVDQHGLGKHRGGVRVSRPVSPDSNGQDNEKRMIEDPFLSARQVFRCTRRIALAVRIETDHFRLRLDGKAMKRGRSAETVR